jgi:hypothetical protein
MVSMKRTCATLCVMWFVARPVSMLAGGALETFDITGRVPSPIPGHIIARVIPLKWDARAIPVKFSVNNTLDPIPNPLGAGSVSIANVIEELQSSLEIWNRIPTSFIEMRIAGTTSNLGLRGFDFVNEVTFRTSTSFGAIAGSPSVSLVEDTEFCEGDDIDEDGDPDVAQGIHVTTDVDGDGDLEFPVGLYKAGTVLDNDVEFNTKDTNGYRFTLDRADADANTRSVDLRAVAVHEFGHSHGLSHSVINQISQANGTAATMFPILDTGDPASEIAQRSLSIDDIAYSSFFYPEGSRRVGPAALQPGDLAFRRRFGMIKGELWHGRLGQPIAGGHVFTVKMKENEIGTGGFSGTTQLSFDPARGGFSLIDPAFNVLDGKFVIPVPEGRYRLAIEPIDGQPVPTTLVSVTSLIGTFFGHHDFNEEFGGRVLRARDEFERNDESSDRFGFAGSFAVEAGETRRRINIVTSRDINIDSFGSRNFLGFADSPPGRLYAVGIPASRITDAGQDRELVIKGAVFDTSAADASVVPTFAEALLTTGVINPDGTASVAVANPLAHVEGFVGQDNDLAPLFFRRARALGRRVRTGINKREIQNVFLVLRIPTTTPFEGVSGIPPLIGLDGDPGGTNDVPILGLSFISDDDGATFTRVDNFNFRFSLRLAEPSHEDRDDGDGWPRVAKGDQDE